MQQKTIDQFKQLATDEDNPHALARALGKTIQEFEYLRQLCRKVLDGDETAKALLRIEVDS